VSEVIELTIVQPSRVSHRGISRRRFIALTGAGGVAAVVGEQLLTPSGVVSAWDGAAMVDMWQTAPGSAVVKFYGAGWPYSWINTHYAVYHDGGLVWQDWRSYHATGFSFTWNFDCGPGYWYATCEASSSTRGPFSAGKSMLVV
jgi:hypothetical protein